MSSLTTLATGLLAPERARRWTRRLLLDRQAALLLAEIDPTRSFSEIRARVVNVIAETGDTRTFFLRPNGRWQGHRAGQYVPVEVEIDGVRVRRCYSISSAPGAPLVAITVKRVPGGRVSGWLHDRIRPGHVLGLGAAGGDFVLDRPAPEPLLMYSGGSGITPLMSILRELAARGAVGDLVFVHHARSRREVIFGDELQALAARHPGLRLELRLDDELAADRRFDEAWLERAVPDFARRTTMLCGPPGLMGAVETMWQRAGASGNLRREHFALPVAAARASPGEAAAVSVNLTSSERTVAAMSARPLLEQLEEAGERPAHGCRMGICNTCACRKRRGSVRNLLTGEVSSEPDEDIRLCISAAESDLELQL